MRNGEDRVAVAYVTGLPHSGSTLLDLLIGAHSQALSGGELKVLSARRGSAGRAPTEDPCTCGAARLAECRFWGQIDERVRRAAGYGVGELDVYSDDAKVFARDNMALFRALRMESGARVVVDSSKDLERLQKLLALPGLDVRPIHLTRNSYGVVYSNVRLGRSLPVHARRWVFTERAIRDELDGRPHVDVAYDSLVSSPRQTLGALMTFLGLEMEPGQLEWESAEHHNVAGNPMRFEKKARLEPDEAWRRGLSASERAHLAWILFRCRLRIRQRLRRALGRRTGAAHDVFR